MLVIRTDKRILFSVSHAIGWAGHPIAIEPFTAVYLELVEECFVRRRRAWPIHVQALIEMRPVGNVCPDNDSQRHPKVAELGSCVLSEQRREVAPNPLFA